MKKKIISIALASSLALSAFALTACTEKKEQGGADSDAITVARVTNAPAVFVDNAETKYTDDAIMTDTLVYTYAADADVTVSLEAGEEFVTLSEREVTTEGEISTAEYVVTAKALGDYTLRFYDGGKADGCLDLTVRPAYPEDPNFHSLTYSSGNPAIWTEEFAHDPVIVEADGKYYTFSTDNFGDFGYQVRESEDLIHFNYIGTAIPNTGSASDHSVFTDGNAELQPVYDLLSTDGNWDGSCWTLWAPDVVPAADGGYWLYGCWTAAFGQGHSIIFQCHADEITGPYEYVDMLVYSWDGWQGTPNAIDPSIYYDADGNMWMAYGSFNGGIWTLELDPETGLRKDGYAMEDMVSGTRLSAEQRYGWTLISTNIMEGPVIQYKEDVPVYNGDVKQFDAAQMTYVDRYYMMGSQGSLSSDYNMRSYWSASPNEGFTSDRGVSGDRVSGSFSWRVVGVEATFLRGGYDFHIPGHNDMITTSEGVDLLAYHNRSQLGGQNHYLFVSMYALNSKGVMVMSPNRYAGEALREISEEELLQYSGGSYAYIIVDSSRYDQATNNARARTDMKLEADNVITVGGEQAGSWYLYGENYVYIELNGVEYYGVAMPAWIDAYGKSGITLSCVSANGEDCLYIDSAF